MAEKEWQRRDGETPPAYDAFQEYLRVRSTGKVATSLGKSTTIIERWCSVNDWVARSVAFDRFLNDQSIDGMVHDLAACRDKNLALMDKLRGHLSDRLDEFIRTKQDPTIRWTQALTAMAKVEQNSLLMGKDDTKTSDMVLKVEDAVKRLDEALNGTPTK